ncbi:MAG: polymer-forming cytoskeletal protein [Planctomycetota bacterium]
MVAGTRRVLCYHCGAVLELGPTVKSASCPACNRGLQIEDIDVQRYYVGGALQTCGRLVIGRRASVSNREAYAGAGAAVLGVFRGSMRAGGPVVIGPGASWEGELEAPAIDVMPGAKVVGARFRIRPELAADLD